MSYYPGLVIVDILCVLPVQRPCLESVGFDVVRSEPLRIDSHPYLVVQQGHGYHIVARDTTVGSVENACPAAFPVNNAQTVTVGTCIDDVVCRDDGRNHFEIFDYGE